MKPSNSFKEVIRQHLEQRAASDELFAVTFAKEGKNIDDCCTYILNQVKKSGCNGFADDEIYNMAVHYYDEDSIDIGKPVNSRVVVNHSAPAETQQKKVRQEPKPAPPKQKKENKPQYVTGSLFD